MGVFALFSSGRFFYIGDRYSYASSYTLNLTTLKLTRFILFSDGLKWLLVQVKGILRIAWRILLCIVKGFRGLRVDTLMINDIFLLSNGLIEVQWKVRYAWTVRINGKQLDPRMGRYTLYSAGEETVLDIHIRGLLRNYRERFTIRATGSIDPGAFPLPFLQRALVTDTIIVRDIGAIIPSFSSFEVDRQALPVMVDKTVSNFQIILPPIQTPTNHDQRLLHNT